MEDVLFEENLNKSLKIKDLNEKNFIKEDKSCQAQEFKIWSSQDVKNLIFLVNKGEGNKKIKYLLGDFTEEDIRIKRNELGI